MNKRIIIILLFLSMIFIYGCPVVITDELIIEKSINTIELDVLTLPENVYEAIPDAELPLGSITVDGYQDLSVFFPTPGDQGDTYSCVGWAAGYAYKSYAEYMKQGWDLSKDEHLFSPTYIYNQINNGDDKGALLYDALELLKSQGVSSFSTMPFDKWDRDFYTLQPTTAARNEALSYKIKGFQKIRLLDWLGRPRADLVDDIKSFLEANKPIIVGISCNKNSVDEETGVFSASEVGGHAMVIVGYDDTLNRVKVINSDGESWGDNGYGYIPYDVLMVILKEAYVIEEPTVTKVLMPTFLPDGGIYSHSAEVELTTDTLGATIIYTTDGSIPSESNGVQIASGTNIILNQSCTLNAVAIMTGMEDSFIKTSEYSITQAPTPYTLTVNAGSGGSVSPSGSSSRNSGDVVAVSASANSGYTFSHWIGNVANSSASSTTVTMTGNQTVTANFTQNAPTPYTLTVNAGSGGSVSPSGSSSRNSGDVVAVSASANSGYTFSHWIGNVANSSASSTTVTMTGNQTVTANFSQISYDPIVVTTPSSSSVWSTGESNVSVKWDEGNIGGTVTIELWSGSSRITTLTSSTSNDGSYGTWDIPTSFNTYSSCFIRVISNTDNSISDDSANFSLKDGEIIFDSFSIDRWNSAVKYPSSSSSYWYFNGTNDVIQCYPDWLEVSGLSTWYTTIESDYTSFDFKGRDDVNLELTMYRRYSSRWRFTVYLVLNGSAYNIHSTTGDVYDNSDVTATIDISDYANYSGADDAQIKFKFEKASSSGSTGDPTMIIRELEVYVE